MPISWSDAVMDADNEVDLQRYRRAVAQACDLEPLIESFANEIRRAGKWPTTTDEYSKITSDVTLSTRHSGVRQVWISPDAKMWGIGLGDEGYKSGIQLYLVRKRFHQDPDFGYEDVTVTIASEDFGPRMDAMEHTKDWVPRELVGYLRANDIAIPN
ncbi:hypothetical protein [Arthrobacter methylotrophus]|uniref:hypothetical protein n=1 Tax=Arthrobacter methylotrophus TaxID=121291 RepID=UPI0031E9F7D3